MGHPVPNPYPIFNIITAGFLMAGLCHTDSDGAGQDEVDKVCGDDEEEEQD